ncbi:FHA domain-containing protein [bacterium]|nr:FHA domain-containing protein [bacterium]
MAKLIVMFKDQTLREVHVGNETIKIGRDSSNHIHLENPAVSRFHAEIYRQGFPFFVEDKKSTNGVHVNDVLINWKSGIKDGDRITIGKHTLVFREESTDHPDLHQVSLTDIDGTIALDGGKLGKKK